jgi:hypothetical protein
MLAVVSVLRRVLLATVLSATFACGGGGGEKQDVQASAIPEGRCEKDADCKADERCAEVAMICDAPPYCGACVAAPR